MVSNAKNYSCIITILIICLAILICFVIHSKEKENKKRTKTKTKTRKKKRGGWYLAKGTAADDGDGVEGVLSETHATDADEVGFLLFEFLPELVPLGFAEIELLHALLQPAPPVDS